MKYNGMILLQKVVNKMSRIKDIFKNKKKEAEYQKIANSYWESCKNRYWL